MQHGKPHDVVSDDQLEAREGRSGRYGVTERLVVPRKSGNAGGDGMDPPPSLRPCGAEGQDGWCELIHLKRRTGP
jgi:hypothetical protein